MATINPKPSLADTMNATARTENGARQYHTTNSACLDLFSTIGSCRNNTERAIDLFREAMIENPDLAIRILLWAHDVRGGAGERQVFKDIMVAAINGGIIPSNIAAMILTKVPEYGRWSTLLYLLEHINHKGLQSYILKLIASALKNGDKLCGKWMPRQGFIAERIRNYLVKSDNKEWTRKYYRKTLVNLSKGVTEQLISSNKWEVVTYDHVPSVAMTRYANAFMRHDGVRFNKYIKDVTKGDAKMNMKVAFPHDIIRGIRCGTIENKAACTMWNNLKKIDKIKSNVLCMADVSGSMTQSVSGAVTALDVSIGTAIYVAQNSTSRFKNQVMLFSDTPKLVSIENMDVVQAYTVLRNTMNPYGTNFAKAYMLMLNTALQYNLPESEMPDTLLVLSDMEFNIAPFDDTLYESIVRSYTNAGYKIPKLIFWNLNAYGTGFVMVKDIPNSAMISGYSPNILNSIFDGKVPTPYELMIDTVMVDRYDLFKPGTNDTNAVKSKKEQQKPVETNNDAYVINEDRVRSDINITITNP